MDMVCGKQNNVATAVRHLGSYHILTSSVIGRAGQTYCNITSTCLILYRNEKLRHLCIRPAVDHK